ncbi:AraC family transcriptional regulator [uncultured Kordia sp.]|uniref:AraC family transcriptional regulator n=1 Tax=uncultured Kordia sp. TaxID=507699 RepID=UPI0026016538|nr:AraC family transcriptional regulator [uncultured Kordia sp.]
MLLLQKRISLLLFAFFICCSHKAVSSTVFQDTVTQFNAEEFKTSLQKMEPKTFARLFTQQYRQDSLRVNMSLSFIENDMLQSEDLLTQFWGNYSLAHWYKYKLDFQQSIIYVNRLYEIAEKLNNNNFKLTALLYAGNFYYEYGRYKESMESYLKAIKLAKELKDLRRQLGISHNIALLKIEVDDNKGAVELLEGTLEIVEKGQQKKFKGLEVGIYIALTKSYMRLENYTKAEYFGNKGIDLSDEYGDEDAKTYFYNFLGEIYLAQHKYQKAIQFLDLASNYANTIKTSSPQLPFINLNRAKIFYYQKEYHKSIAILEKIEVNQQQENTNFFSLEDMYKYLGKSYKAIGNTEKSLFYFEKVNEVYTENDKQQSAIGIEIIKKYDLAELKAELDNEQVKSKNKSTLLYASLSLILILITSFIFIYKHKETQNKKNFEKLISGTESKKEILVSNVPKNNTSDISDKIASEILEKLKAFEIKEMYLKKDSSLNHVASKLKTNPKYLSKTINTFKNKTFSNYIRDLRIEYVIHRLKNDKKFRAYTIQAIAKEIGYKSTEPFSKAFKAKTGLYPSYFIKQLNNT